MWPFSSSTSTPPLPPGPPRKPFIGNALDIPQEQPWLKMSDWAEEYGELVYLDVFGKSIVIINSLEVAKELLDKRSSIYSNRPELIMADLSGYGRTFVIQSYGETWRKQRRLISQDLGPGSAPKYHFIQDNHARILASNLLQRPDILGEELITRIGAIIMRATFGYDVKSVEDPILTLPLTAMVNFNKATVPGAYLVDLVPFLRYMPTWIPGLSFLKTAKEWDEIVCKGSWRPYNYAREAYKAGTLPLPNICASAFAKEQSQNPEDLDNYLVWAASTVMGGGLDTNISTVLLFLFAMLAFPEIQTRAQAEVDALTGKTCLPSASDASSLVYVRKIITEALRLSPVIPTGFPHSTSQDDVYEGMYIPKDTIIIPNVWHMLHDPKMYENPNLFNPDRYETEEDMQTVQDMVFGFGRRVCPGRHFAFGTFMAIIPTILATCNIETGVDENGEKIPLPELELTSGTIISPKPFPCTFSPRFPHSAEMLAQSINQ